MKTIHVAAAALVFALSTTTVLAQEIVDAAPSNRYAVAAGDVASPALAQLNDAADSANAARKVDLYKQLMEMNGQARNIRNVIGNTKAATRLIVVERTGRPALSAEDNARYDVIATSVLGQTEAALINDIAVTQSAGFSADEIQQLIVANSSVAAAKYNAGKFSQSEANTQQIQSYMVEAVIKIIKTFQESMAS
ncbi:hypothetical protein [Asticcacaulis sp. AC402]|uniref:hypothetical protein n=1 Tax=Asticcacaulis sp. AC402 TaxID=1282361 RepID=UPI0003C3BB84|nr:hypothetical protein [Asticcacaulis sp. AC402]ESQ77151.1 hypothetical protein ABAC402_01765 [Asticcacaulis sp. AC402]